MWTNGSEDPKDSNISLNALLMNYLGVENDQKEEIGRLMKSNPDIWWEVTNKKSLIMI